MSTTITDLSHQQSTPITARGACLCKSITYVVHGDPFYVLACHCANCQRVSGAVCACNAFFKDGQVVITQGKEHLKVYADKDTKNGNTVFRSFCRECGSSMFGLPPPNNEKDTTWCVHTGTLDRPDKWRPKHQYFGDNKRAWIGMPEDVECREIDAEAGEKEGAIG